MNKKTACDAEYNSHAHNLTYVNQKKNIFTNLNKQKVKKIILNNFTGKKITKIIAGGSNGSIVILRIGDNEFSLFIYCIWRLKEKEKI